MKICFVSNYINHHQIPFCNAMQERLGEDFFFIQTQPMEEERVKMGWHFEKELLPYLHFYYEEEDFCKALIADSDVVLFGGVEDESYIRERLQSGKIVVRLSERIYKNGRWRAISPRGLRQKYRDHTRYRKAPVYLLCCGGYVAGDFRLVHAYPGKMLRWGYFPECREQDIEALLAAKKKRRTEQGCIRLIWAGRFIHWKHPEYAVYAARKLQEAGIDFRLTMVGNGELDEKLRAMTVQYHLTDKVEFTGFQSPTEVRRRMEESDIHLFTSDEREGWGAVLNESMNSGCAAVCDCSIGAVPFLYEGDNMCIYPHKDFRAFYKELTNLIQNPDKIEQTGRNAYLTIWNKWNAGIAAGRLCVFLEGLLEGEIRVQEEGILSPAPAAAPQKMYRRLHKGAL